MTATMPHSRRNNQPVARSALKVTVGGVGCMLASLASQVVVASVFGAGRAMDAFFMAVVVPSYLQGVLLSGIPFVVIPAFVDQLERGRDKDGWALVRTVSLVLMIALIGSSLLLSRAAPAVIRLIAPGFDASKAADAAAMLAVVAFVVPVTGIADLAESVQHSEDRFLLPALAPAAGSLANAVFLATMASRLGVMALAWGYLINYVLQAMIKLIPLRRSLRGRLLSLGDQRTLGVLRLLGTHITLGFVTFSRSLFERFFASGLPDGDLSYLGYAQRIGTMAMSVLGSGIVLATFPAMARGFTRKGLPGMAHELQGGLRLASAGALLAMALTCGAAGPLVSAVLRRGAFDSVAADSVSRILPIAMLGTFVFQMVGTLIARSFYVTRDTLTTSIVSAIMAVLYVPLGFILVRVAGYVGLAWLMPFYYGSNMAVLGVLALRRSEALRRIRVGQEGVYLVAGLLSYAATRGSAGALEGRADIVVLIVSAMAGVCAFVLVIYALSPDLAWRLLRQTTGIVLGTVRDKAADAEGGMAGSDAGASDV